MDKDTRNLLLVIAVATITLFIFKPRNKKVIENVSIKKPNLDKDAEYNNAVIAIEAMRSAINDGEPSSELDKLNSEIVTDYNLKLFIEEGKLIARNRQKEAIAKEE